MGTCTEQPSDWPGVGRPEATPGEGSAGTLPSLGWAGLGCAELRRLEAGLGCAGLGWAGLGPGSELIWALRRAGLCWAKEVS